MEIFMSQPVVCYDIKQALSYHILEFYITTTVYCKLFKVEKFAIVEMNCNLLENTFFWLHGSLVWLNPIA